MAPLVRLVRGVTVEPAIFSYFLAIYLYGSMHFQDLFSKIVLQWVWVYAIIVILVGQFAWQLGLKNARSGDVSLATSFSPLAGIVIAMLLLGEDPGPGLVPGGLVILAAIGVGQYGRIRHQRAEKAAQEEEALDTNRAMEAESRVNFKGA